MSYSQNSTFTHQMFTVNVKDSIITNLKYNGEVLDNYYYLVLKTYIKNNSTQKQKLDYDNFNIYMGKKVLKPVLDRSTYFYDYANQYLGEYLKSGEEKEIALVYRLEPREIKKSFKLKLLSGFSDSKDKLVTTYAIVNLTPVILDNIVDQTTVNMGTMLSFMNSNVGNTLLTVNNYEITKSYVYEYEHCYSENNCKTIKDIANIDYTTSGTRSATLLVLDYDFDLDNETTYGKSVKKDLKFFDDFASVKSSIGGNTNEYDATNITPKELKNKLILQVKGDIQNTEDLDLYLTIRNKRYIINLK